MEEEQEECSARIEREQYGRSMAMSARSVESRREGAADSLKQSDIVLVKGEEPALRRSSSQSDLGSQARSRVRIPLYSPLAANCPPHSLLGCMELEA